MGNKMKKFEKRLNELVSDFEQFKNEKIRECPEIGDTIKVAGMKWVVLDKTEDGYAVITKDFIDMERGFDDSSNNWISSDLRNYLNTEFLKKISEDIGTENILEFERDLTSLDGQTEYESCMDKVSILTVDEYRKYRKLLPNMNMWWWLITPWSTECNGCNKTVAVVTPSGVIGRNVYDYGNGIRPFCIFSSSIFESLSEKG